MCDRPKCHWGIFFSIARKNRPNSPLVLRQPLPAKSPKVRTLIADVIAATAAERRPLRTKFFQQLIR